jgi:NADH-quinone oxidoreductase subunit F
VKIDISQIQPVLEKYRSAGRTALLPALHEAQAIYGFLPREVAYEIGRALPVPLADVYGVIDFYALFYTEPVSKTIIHICNDPICSMAGAETVHKRFTQKIDLVINGDIQTRMVTIERSPCLGLCEHAPSLLVKGTAVVDSNHLSIEQLIAGEGRTPHPEIGGDI